MDWNPVWSPDGEFLYFLSDRGGRIGIWRVSMNRNDATSMSEPVPIAVRSDDAAHLAIARDGRHLAWSTLEWSPALFRVDFEADTRSTRGSATAVATGPVPWQCAEPSPDGSLIAFASDHLRRDIHVMRLDNGEVRKVTDDSATEGCPRWSPDGRRIIFHSDAGGLNKLWVADADGTGLRLAASAIGELTNPVWAPDSRAVAAWDSYASTLRLIRLREGGAFSSERLPAPPHPFTPVSWSSDGTRIAGTAAGTLWIYYVPARTYELLLPGSAPTWLSTGRRLVFASHGRLMMLDVPSRYTREILAMPDLQLDAPFLSPDDRHLYFNRNTPEANVWLLTLRQGF
jgi:Tol biopolymer transport system component